MRPLASHASGKGIVYNRLWHLDVDQRRHHGRRKWSPRNLEALLDVIASFEFLYPPDFSARDCIRFHSTGGRLFAELFTDDPSRLKMVLHRSDLRAARRGGSSDTPPRRRASA